MNRRFSGYDIGRTPHYACQLDQRFSYCLYVPKDYEENSQGHYNILVTVHGTRRSSAACRDQFIEFADQQRCIVVAPLFPAGIMDPGDISGYKFLKFYNIRFDLVLLSMVDEVADKYGLRSNRFLLHGFSGGGHFAHRFFYLHPQRLLAASIGSPGTVTLLDPARDWWIGVRDFEGHFGQVINYENLRQVPILTIIGADDTDTNEIFLTPSSRFWMEGANDTGRNRLERIISLGDSLRAAGIDVNHVVVPNVGHSGFRILEPVRAFFADILARNRASDPENEPGWVPGPW